MAAGASQVTVEVLKDHPAQVGNFGCNGKAPQTAVTLPANATDLASAEALVNAIKAALIANGICA
jgi:hypothetical protein